jgi:peptide/nickel transport system substrate-binding protein
MKSLQKLAVSIGIVAVAAVSLLAAGWAGAQSKAQYPRAKTLYTSGTQWSAGARMNPYGGSYATGMVGLVNETLLRYDPLKDEYINWLAKSAAFTSAKVFVVKVRPGIKWSNGKKFTASDVAFNFKLGRFKTAPWNKLWLNIASVETKGNTVTFTFKGTPNYAQWQNLIWNLPMVNPRQYKGITKATFTSFSPKNPIGTGPYTLASLDTETRVVWKKKAVWWAAKQKVSPSPAPTYIIDLRNTSITNSLSGLLTEIEDLNNSYLPGVATYVKTGQMQTYYPSAPYDLSADTAWLTPNTTHKPLNDRAFRRALATSIDIANIVKNDYDNLVTKANATGLPRIWNKWVDQKQSKSLGFSYSTSKAKSLLAAAGYKDVNNDGYVENKNGSTLDLKIAVPSDWPDLEQARDMIITSAGNAGIHITKDEGDFYHYQNERNSGAFDLVIDTTYLDNGTYQISDNPWTYFNALFHKPILSNQTFANFSRYSNNTAWNLVGKLDKTPLGNTSKRKSLMKQLEKIELTDLPNIPLWYEGIWAQTQSGYWTKWPSSTSTRNYVPYMGPGYLQMTGIDMLTHIKPAQAK